MGEVYWARDAKLDRDVAVKVLPASVANDPDALARFEREAKAVAALSHQNILSIFDFGRHEGIAYVVTELLDGGTLRGKLDAGAISQKQATDYGAPDREGTLGGARARNRPPGPQARERVRHEGRARQDPRLRAGQADRGPETGGGDGCCAAFDDDRGGWGLCLAQVSSWRGDVAQARKYAEEARKAFEDQLRAAPDDAHRHAVLGVTLAYLGRGEEAIRQGERAVELRPVAKDADYGTYYLHQLVRTYILAGQPEKAIDNLERLLQVPHYISPAWLKIDPNFDPLRGNPRFQKLVAR